MTKHSNIWDYEGGILIQTTAHCFWECVLLNSLWKSVWRSFNNLEINLSYELDVPTLRYMHEDLYILL